MTFYNNKQYEQLIKNGSDRNPSTDFPPIVRFKIEEENIACWISKLSPVNNDMAYGLIAYNKQNFFYGWFKITSLQNYEGRKQLFEPDIDFYTVEPLSDTVQSFQNLGWTELSDYVERF
jgi:hypothetical protein